MNYGHAGSVTAISGGVLANTGGNFSPVLMAIAIALIIVGIGAIVFSRLRNRRERIIAGM